MSHLLSERTAEMDWMTSLPPAVAAAVVSAIVSLVVALITTLVAPTVKYKFDTLFERRKLELAYVAEQSKALRDRIGHHKGSIMAAAESLANRFNNYEDVIVAPSWLYGSGRSGNYKGTFLFRILAFWCSLDGLSREAIYIDTAVATDSDRAFVKAVRLNFMMWSEVSLFNGLGYSGDKASDHFFHAQMLDLAESFRALGSDRPPSTAKFMAALAAGCAQFDALVRYLSGLRRSSRDPKYQRLVAAHLVIIATLNAFGDDYQMTAKPRVRRIATHCGPAVRQNLRRMIADMHLARYRGFCELYEALGCVSPDASEKGVRAVSYTHLTLPTN